MQYDQDDLCRCGHFYGEHELDPNAQCDKAPSGKCWCIKFHYDARATQSNIEAEEATWD